MILNNLFLFILLDFCTRVFRLIWTRHTQQIDWSIWNGKKVSIVGCTVLCMFWHFSFSTRGNKQKRDPWDYRWTLAAKRSSLFFSSVDRYWMRKKRNTSWCNFQWMRDKKGKKRFVYSWVECQLVLLAKRSALKIDFPWSIELKFIWYWTKVKIFSCIPSSSSLCCLVIATCAVFMISIYTQAHPSSSHKLFILPVARNRREFGADAFLIH